MAFFFLFHFKRKRHAAILFVRRERASLTIWASEGLGERRPLCGGIQCQRGRCLSLLPLTPGWPRCWLAQGTRSSSEQSSRSLSVSRAGGRGGGGWGGSLTHPAVHCVGCTERQIAPQTFLCSAPFFSAQCVPSFFFSLFFSSFSASLPFFESIPLLVGGFRVSMDSWPEPAVTRAFHCTHTYTCTPPPSPACQPGSGARAIFL